ncbi:hypothetical protein [Streptomyces californicus]|uniref:hypothetical protein n=1 Tax=Streptomyces californicus TaxID=67351 RepID=UPI00296FD47C|nr:hypothetical protein [Streptomyces californicus]MDW4916409.1 hypothetical protein [Streptomyces californicus]
MKISLGAKMLLIVVCVLISLVVALVASWIKHSSGASLSDTVAFGGGAFATCMVIGLAVLTFGLL